MIFVMCYICLPFDVIRCCCLLLAVCLYAVCRLSFVVCCLLFGDVCLLFVVRRLMLFVIQCCSLSFVVCVCCLARCL